jgi:glycosyltransferase involved in cell wall biosynthesis
MTAPKRILWAVNIPLPAASEALGLAKSPFGGWLSTMTQRLGNQSGIELGVVMRAPVPEVRSVEVDGIRYFALPQTGKGGLDARAEDCAKVLADFKPDLLHAEGSEMAYTRRMLEAWSGPRLLSLQGVINGIEPHQLGALRPLRMLLSLRPRQMLAALALVLNKRFRFDPRLAGERETATLADHIMGRTLWDRSHAWAMNPSAQYHQCHRTLRAPFYVQRWAVGRYDRHTIFVGNSSVPLKGVHHVLEAIALLRREFPDVRLVIAGETPGNQSSRLRRMAGYSSYLQDRIIQLGLGECVEFTGLLDATEMASRMARCHVYVMGSLIENSPNTLGEAMLLGMPCAASYAGGAPSMASDEREALFFRAGDPVTMAYQIKRLFDSDALCERLGEAAHVRALQTHDAEANLQDLLDAYQTILQSKDAP